MSDSNSKASAKAIAKALRQHNNEWSNKYFAIAIGAIMVLFGVYHWASVLHAKSGSKASPSLTRKYREARRFLSSSFMGLRKDRTILYTIYWAINLILALTNVDLTEPSYVAKRFGWISIANLVLLVFLALKNTPLAPFTATSYEKLRPLHKVAGYTCIVTTLLHAIVYLAAWSATGKLENMTERKNYCGAIAGMAMVIIGFSTITYFMRGYYELFYLLHIVMFILIIITVGMHRPVFSSHTVIIVVFIACLWTLDRIIRGLKIIWNFFGNTATVTALPNNAIRVRLSRRMYASPGNHAFLWIPAIRWVESHPFTMLSSTPCEFVIRVYDGFTRDLYEIAQKNPGQSLRCSVDGPYGQVPDFKLYDRAVLVAGGSGASFTFSIALDLINASKTSIKTIDFIWIVREKECLEWFAQELKQLGSHPNVNLLIHVTRSTDMSGTPSSRNLQTEKVSLDNAVEPSPVQPSNDLEKSSLENSITPQTSVNELRPGRPDITKVIADAVALSNGTEDRIIVGACGPSELMAVTRRAVHSDIHNDGPSLTLYTEEFEW